MCLLAEGQYARISISGRLIPPVYRAGPAHAKFCISISCLFTQPTTTSDAIAGEVPLALLRVKEELGGYCCNPKLEG